MLEEDMVAPVYLLHPGGEHERMWLEEIIHVTRDGGRPRGLHAALDASSRRTVAVRPLGRVA